MWDVAQRMAVNLTNYKTASICKCQLDAMSRHRSMLAFTPCTCSSDRQFYDLQHHSGIANLDVSTQDITSTLSGGCGCCFAAYFFATRDPVASVSQTDSRLTAGLAVLQRFTQTLHDC
jgi:hypothetical protein